MEELFEKCTIFYTNLGSAVSAVSSVQNIIHILLLFSSTKAYEESALTRLTILHIDSFKVL
jgi:hypothetical protein